MSKEKPKRGRPPKPPGEAKGLVYQIRLTEAERKQFEDAANRLGIPLAQWIRERLTGAAKKEQRTIGG